MPLDKPDYGPSGACVWPAAVFVFGYIAHVFSMILMLRGPDATDWDHLFAFASTLFFPIGIMNGWLTIFGLGY